MVNDQHHPQGELWRTLCDVSSIGLASRVSSASISHCGGQGRIRAPSQYEDGPIHVSLIAAMGDDAGQIGSPNTPERKRPVPAGNTPVAASRNGACP